MTDIKAFLPLNPRDYQILFVLLEGEKHGYGMAKEIERRTDGHMRLEPANLYRTVKRLVEWGLVEKAERRETDDLEDERRRYYGITKLGREVVSAEALRMRALVDEAASKKVIPAST